MAKIFYFHGARTGRIGFLNRRKKERVEASPATEVGTTGRGRGSGDWAGKCEKFSLSRPMFYIVVMIAVTLLVILAELARAEGPKYVAGVSYFDAGVKGTPLTWAQGSVAYYTDQGNLSPILPGSDADAFVADAFTRWASVATAAIAVTHAGQLAEDVSGSNVYVNPDGTISMPADVQPTATATPVGIVYDYDGAVTDALLGQGAGGTGLCFTNAVLGGPDNLSSAGHILHALVVINGNCVQTSTQLPDVKYRLVRLLGEVLGLGWSQVNINVITRNPVPVPDDFAGFPVMHFADRISCVPISVCYSNADQPKMDDRAAISRLYPITSQNQANFPGKQLFYENTARVHGTVYFVDAHGQPAQPMQGVNVVARWINPATGLPSRYYVATSVSGFLFRGNAGNMVNGPNDSAGERYDRFGSDDSAVEGFFDLPGLEIPDGSNTAQYQLSVEGLDALWSAGVGPYAPVQVTPSGAAQPIAVTVTKGGDVQQDLLMQGSAVATPDWGESASYLSPAALPPTGDWAGLLSGYGDADFFQFAAQADRTVSVAVTALDESGAASEVKARPIIGIWQLSDPVGTLAPSSTPASFNTASFGLTRLDTSLSASTSLRIGITDERGDGRPDFRYHARVLYADTVSPQRLSLQGGTPLMIAGLGFRPGLTASIGGINAPVLVVSANHLVVRAPTVAQDGVQSLTVTDPVTGAFSMMADVLMFGAAATDSIGLVEGWNPATPVGGQTPNPIRVRVTTANGNTPVSGASVVWSTTSGMLSACGGASGCTVFTNQSGEISTWVTVTAAGSLTVTATLAPAVYNPAKFVQTTVLGTSSPLDIALTSQTRWMARGASMNFPLTARVLSNGTPRNGVVVNYFLEKGVSSLSSGSATTDSNGYANINLGVSNLSGEVDVSACVAPANAPCKTFTVYAVDPSALKLVVLGGSGQMVAVGQAFQPIMLQVTDSATPPNPVQGATVSFRSVVLRPGGDGPVVTVGDTTIGNHAMPVILGSSQTAVISDLNGLVSLVPSTGTFAEALEVDVTAIAGTNAVQQFQMELLWPVVVGTAQTSAATTSVGGESAPNSSAASADSGRDVGLERPIHLPNAPGRFLRDQRFKIKHRVLRRLARESASQRAFHRPRQRPVIFSPTGRPSHSRSCTRADCSAASAPSGLRRGNKASLTEHRAAAAW